MQQYQQDQNLKNKLNKVNTDLRKYIDKVKLQPYYEPNISLDCVNYDVNIGKFSADIRSKGYFVVDDFFKQSLLFELNNFLLTHPFDSATESGVHHLNVPFCNSIFEDVQAVYRDLEDYKLEKSFFTLHWYETEAQENYNLYDGVKLEIFLTPEEYSMIEALGGTFVIEQDGSHFVSENPFYKQVNYENYETAVENAPFFGTYIGYKFNRALFTKGMVTSSPNIVFENEVQKAKKTLVLFLKKKT